MSKAVLLGQWYSLSGPELEYSIITRIDFQTPLRPMYTNATISNRCYMKR